MVLLVGDQPSDCRSLSEVGGGMLGGLTKPRVPESECRVAYDDQAFAPVFISPCLEPCLRIFTHHFRCRASSLSCGDLGRQFLLLGKRL